MKAISVDVVSDVICPWCFLGKRRLDKAIGLLEDIKVEVNWRPFFLDPTIPAEGMSRRTYLENKFGAERLKTLHDPILAAGKEDGVPYAFDKITRTPNTMDAHRLIRWSHDGGKQHDVASACSWPISMAGLISVTARCWRRLQARPGWTQPKFQRNLRAIRILMR